MLNFLVLQLWFLLGGLGFFAHHFTKDIIFALELHLRMFFNRQACAYDYDEASVWRGTKLWINAKGHIVMFVSPNCSLNVSKWPRTTLELKKFFDIFAIFCIHISGILSQFLAFFSNFWHFFPISGVFFIFFQVINMLKFW